MRVALTTTALVLSTALALTTPLGRLLAQSPGKPAGPGQPITLLSDVQQADAKTGIVTATGNVQIFYPARGITATSAQAQYFSQERRIVLTGNVFVYQEGGNSLRGEVVTYFVDEERMEAFPYSPQQVESVYVIEDAGDGEEDTEESPPAVVETIPDLP
ncbi:LptA/OstA family protein [Prochlorothrix hollandica]|uniref:LptA/OstA family protein n=1 Tax=Prochlorothrix hollandica TaxID=1223 RepID=UPI003DA78396